MCWKSPNSSYLFFVALRNATVRDNQHLLGMKWVFSASLPPQTSMHLWNLIAWSPGIYTFPNYNRKIKRLKAFFMSSYKHQSSLILPCFHFLFLLALGLYRFTMLSSSIAAQALEIPHLISSSASSPQNCNNKDTWKQSYQQLAFYLKFQNVWYFPCCWDEALQWG